MLGLRCEMRKKWWNWKKKRSICNHHSKEWFRQESREDLNLGGNTDEKQDICMVSKCLPRLLISCGV